MSDTVTNALAEGTDAGMHPGLPCETDLDGTLPMQGMSAHRALLRSCLLDVCPKLADWSAEWMDALDGIRMGDVIYQLVPGDAALSHVILIGTVPLYVDEDPSLPLRLLRMSGRLFGAASVCATVDPLSQVALLLDLPRAEMATPTLTDAVRSLHVTALVVLSELGQKPH